MNGWSWFDKRTGARETEVTFMTREAAQERLDYYMDNPKIPDKLHTVLERIEVREIP